MDRYTFEDIEQFIMDDEFFRWAKYGSAESGFDIDAYKKNYPGQERKIDAAVAVIRNMNISRDKELFSRSYKMQSFYKVIKKNQQKRELYRKRVFLYVASLAAILFLSFGSYYFFYSHITPQKEELSAWLIDSLARSSQIQIIMDGESAISLNKNNTEIVMEKDGTITVDNVQIASHKTDKIAVNQVVVPYGKRSKIILPDGSSLWINSGSYISYKSNFEEDRRLTVRGEVYLDVKRDENHPFVVKTDHLEVQVLGTAFNVTDYSDEVQPAVVLVRGSVNVKVDNKEKIKLQPNQRLAMQDGKVRIHNNVDVYNYICWKDDLINFEGKTLPYILQNLSRYYDTQISIIGNLDKEVCYGSLDLNRSIDEVLEYISLTVPMKVERKGNMIYVSPIN